MRQDCFSRCPVCCRNFDSNEMLSAENSELRNQNEILAREISVLRRQIEAKQFIYDSTRNLQNPDLRLFEVFCVELLEKFERATDELQKKQRYYEQELYRYRALAGRMMRELHRPAAKENQPTIANQQYHSQPKATRSQDRSTEANITVHESIVVQHTPPKRSYLSYSESLQ